MDHQAQGTRLDIDTDVTVGFAQHDQAMVCRRPNRQLMGNAMSRWHRSIFPAEQLRVWKVCARPTSQWDAYLAGGTAVALYLGHRRSDDFDWFTPQTIPPAKLLADVEGLGFPVSVRQNTEGTFLANVSGVSFSVFRFRYPLLESPVVLDGCALASIRDLAAMKLLAIYQRGTKKDFIDIHAILEAKHFTLPEMFAAFSEKYSIDDTSELRRALVYFDDADKLPMPFMLSRTTWDNVKNGILSQVDAFGKPRRRRK
jgi:hypothetical protein